MIINNKYNKKMAQKRLFQTKPLTDKEMNKIINIINSNKFDGYKDLSIKNLLGLQEKIDKYCKNKNSNLSYKLLKGFYTSALGLFLVGCTVEEPTVQKTPPTSIVEFEQNLEQSLVNFINKDAITNINFLNIEDIKLQKTDDNNYFIVFTSSKMNNKDEDVTIILSISKEQAEKAEKYLEKASINPTMEIRNRDTIAYKYSINFLSGMNETLNDAETKIVSIASTNTEEVYYEVAPTE